MNWDGSAGRIACHGEVGGIITSSLGPASFWGEGGGGGGRGGERTNELMATHIHTRPPIFPLGPLVDCISARMPRRCHCLGGCVVGMRLARWMTG